MLKKINEEGQQSLWGFSRPEITWIEDATPFPWPNKSLDLREKRYLKLRSLSLKDYCLLNKATMVSSKQLIDKLTHLGKI